MPTRISSLPRPWVPSEDEQMRTMLAAGEGVEAVAAKLGRTIDSVSNRSTRLKISTRREPVDQRAEG
jgi:hypothetical protein